MVEAAGWIARLQRDDLNETDGLEFDAWLAAFPDNRPAYRQTLDLWQAFGASAGEVLARMETSARAPGRRGANGGTGAPTRRWLVGAGGFAVAAGLAAVVLPPMVRKAPAQILSSGRGQRRRFQLADGTNVDLNAESRLSVAFSRSERRVSLEDGEAIFDVVSDKARPFTVAAGEHTVRVVGTQFDVRNRDGDLTVTVARGRVEVRPSSASDRVFVLTPGQRLDIGAGGVGTLQAVNPQEAFSWRSGRLVYRAQPLARVVADLNRQFVDQVVIGDPELGAIPITGVIVLDTPQAVMSRLSLMLPVRTVTSERGLLLLRK